MKKRKAIIVHGWGFNPKINWYPWLKKELEAKGYEVVVPEMPDTNEPEINKWVSKLKAIVGDTAEEILFIGHSIGCQTIMRLLERTILNHKAKIIFVAGWFDLKNLEDEEVENIARPWMDTKIDFNKLKGNVSRVDVFLSNNDPYDCLEENKKMFENKLGARVLVLKNKGHFTEDDGIKKLPEILEFLE